MRRHALLLGIVLPVLLVTAGEKPVRNPFARIGAADEREVISADYHLAHAKRLAAREAEARRRREVEERTRLEAEKAARTVPPPESAAAKPVPVAPERRAATDEEWAAALKCIRFGGRIRVTDADGTRRTNVILDGRSFKEGDLKSVTSNGRTFTWRVTGVEGDKPRLKLLRVNESMMGTCNGRKQ